MRDALEVDMSFMCMLSDHLIVAGTARRRRWRAEQPSHDAPLGPCIMLASCLLASCELHSGSSRCPRRFVPLMIRPSRSLVPGLAFGAAHCPESPT